MHRLGEMSVGSAILCELIRPEANNKLSILGVFTSNVILESLPSVLGLAAYIEMVPHRLGKFDIEFKFILPNGSENELSSRVEVTAPGPIGLPLPTLPMTLTEVGPLSLQVRVDQSEWHSVLERSIMLGEVSTPNMMAPRT